MLGRAIHAKTEKEKKKKKLCGIDLTERVVRVVWACSVSGGATSTTRLAVVKPLTLAVTLSINFLFESLVIPTALQERPDGGCCALLVLSRTTGLKPVITSFVSPVCFLRGWRSEGKGRVTEGLRSEGKGRVTEGLRSEGKGRVTEA